MSTPPRILHAQAVYGEEEVRAVLDVLAKPHQLMGGPATLRFEAEVAALLGHRHGVFTNSGSSANLLALAALELPPGSEVITPALTFATTVAPLLQRQLVPVFVDVDPHTLVVRPEDVAAAVGPNTRGLLIPNLVGSVPDWPALRAIADAHGLSVVEDTADTVGATWLGQPTGSWADVSTTSFYASHVITCAGTGGLIATRDPAVADRARLLRGWGRRSALLGESEAIADRFDAVVDGVPYDAKYVFDAVGYNLQAPELAAAFGLVQLERLQGFLQARRDHTATLRSGLAHWSHWLDVPQEPKEAHTAWLAFPMIVQPEAPFDRVQLQRHLEDQGVATRTVLAGNVLRQPGFAHIPHRRVPGGYPGSDRVMEGGVLIGCHQALTPADLAHGVDVIARFCASFR